MKTLHKVVKLVRVIRSVAIIYKRQLVCQLVRMFRHDFLDLVGFGYIVRNGITL